MNKSFTWYRLALILSAVGVGLALYLLIEYLSAPHQSLCYVNSQVNCEASIRGPLARTLGIPTAIYGLAGYLLIALAALRKWPKLLAGVAAFGLLFCLRITFLELFILRVICPVCLACQLDMIAVFLLSLLILRSRAARA